MMIVLLYAK